LKYLFKCNRSLKCSVFKFEFWVLLILSAKLSSDTKSWLFGLLFVSTILFSVICDKLLGDLSIISTETSIKKE